MIIAEMKQPDSVREISPMPPSPVPSIRHSSKKRKRHQRIEESIESDGDRSIPRKRLTHQNSTGFETNHFATSNNAWASGQQQQQQNSTFVPTGRLKAEFSHIPEEG